MSVRTYRKKPVVIEAMWFGAYPDAQEICDWIGDDAHARNTQNGDGPVAVFIQTHEGTMCADIGDFVIREVQGEFYPCKPDIFAQTYEEVSK